MSKSEYIVVMITVPDKAVGHEIARAVVEARLAACVNIVGPITSIYSWQGAIEESSEYLLVGKSTRALFAALADKVNQLHPYEVPEIISLPITDGLPAYLQWIDESTLEG